MADIQNLSESWSGHTKAEVEAFIKSQFGSLDNLKALLGKAPEIIKKSRSYEIKHPLVDYPGAECIIVVYHKKTGKIRKNCASGNWLSDWGKSGPTKKGYCVCRNEEWGGYFDFLEYKSLNSVQSFFSDISSRKLTCGIVLRIPNPEYNGPVTRDRNATYKGVKEMLWSDIRRIKISKESGGISGIGLTI